VGGYDKGKGGKYDALTQWSYNQSTGATAKGYTSATPGKGGKGGKDERDAKGKAKGKNKGKGKGKKPKTPDELHFARSEDGTLWVRSSRLRCGLSAEAAGVEIGNLDEAKLAGKGLSAPPVGFASTEVLCNRQSILGNPFDMKKKEELRSSVLDAYTEYLDAVVGGAQNIPIEAIAEKHDLPPRDHCGKDWRAIYDTAGGPAAVRQALKELQWIALTQHKRGESIRLVCHCAPLPCHAALIASRLGKLDSSSNSKANTATQDRGLAPGRGSLDAAIRTHLGALPSALTDDEKRFMKLARMYREVCEIEKLNQRGEGLTAEHLYKADKKRDVMEEATSLIGSLPADSIVLERNSDIIDALVVGVSG